MENNIPPALPPKAKWSASLFAKSVELQPESVNSNLPLSTDTSEDISLNSQKTVKVDVSVKLPKSKPVPAPRRSKLLASDSNKHSTLAETVVKQEKHNLSNVVNPLYFSPTRIHENASSENSSRNSDTRSRCSFSDTDSIQFLEHHKPSLKKSFSMKEKWKWWSDSSSKRSLPEKVEDTSSDILVDSGGNHIYELYEYQLNHKKPHSHSYEEVLEPPAQKRDIFDLVSFKSPLYGTWLKPSKTSDSVTETSECKNIVEGTVQSVDCNLLLEDIFLQNTDYDIPLKLSIEEKKPNIQIEETDFEIADECNLIYDTPIPEIPPPSHPPPPLPLDITTEFSDSSASPPPLLPPRPMLISSPSSINEEAPTIPVRSLPTVGSVLCSEISNNIATNKPLMPVRPAPPVPRNTIISDFPPPLPEKVSHLDRTASVNSKKYKKKYEINCQEDKSNSSPCCSISKSNSSSSTPITSVSKEIRRSKLYHSGYLFKTGSNRKEFLKRWCVLDGKCFNYYLNEKGSSFRDNIDVKDMVALAVCIPDKHSCSNCQLELCCFELSTVKEGGRQYLFGASFPSERQEWMKFICLNMALPLYRFEDWCVDFTHAGYLLMKEGTSGDWQLAWIILKNRNLLICQLELKTTEIVDLRKSTGVAKLASDSNEGCATASTTGHIFRVDMPQKALYLKAEVPTHTESWYGAIHGAWILPTKPNLKDHYLTQENVPVIIDKCVNFISTHGTTEQGIYRIAGSFSKVNRLMEILKKNVWSVHIKPDEYSIHDVASVLKMFLRELPECIFSEKLYQLWMRAREINCQEERLTIYRDLLHQLPEENYHALKKIIGHLFSISEHEDKNMMPSMNLAAIFGPTMLFSKSSLDTLAITSQTMGVSEVIADFIVHYASLFEIDPKEMEKEKKIQKALELLREAKIAQKPAGDILVGVYIYSKEGGKCLNVRLTPTMTAEDVCLYAFSHADIKESCDKLAVFEIICNGELQRSLHYQEIVLAVTLRWASWAEADATGNYLVIKHNYISDAIMPLIQTRQPLSMFSELKYAVSKTFKTVVFQFSGAKLTCYKDTRASNPLGQWNIEDITWYFGTETKRVAPTRWGFTFIERNKPIKRSKENPYFGNAVCCSTEEEFHKWLAAMMMGEHPNNLLPQRPVPDLLS